MTDHAFILQKVIPGDRRRFDDIKRVAEELQALEEDRTWRVRIEEFKRERSLDANAYYWGVVNRMIADEWGFPVDETHEWLCGEHFGWVDKPCPRTPRNPAGIESKPRRTTTSDETGRRSVLRGMLFWDFVENCRRWAADKLALFIPDPDPAYKIEREKAA